MAQAVQWAVYFLVVLLYVPSLTIGFSSLKPASSRGAMRRHSASLSRMVAGDGITTLTDQTTWNLRFVLRGATTNEGKKVDEIFSVTAKFVEEEGYEPPQGVLKQVPKEGDRLRITRGRWTLSEDPNDRKDGLWVWGLFEEPLYPYLLLRIETDTVPLTGDESSSDYIKPLQLYAQINHKRDADTGVVLDTSTELSVRQMETVNADPFGAASVDIYDNVQIGTLSIQPMEAVPVS